VKRFWDKVQFSDTCWLWQAACVEKGYGVVKVRGRMERAHRVAYELARGPIPEGMVIDHLCRVRHCVRPDHLEVVTYAENNRRGANGFALTGRCRAGLHDMTDPANVYEHHGARRCRPCSQLRRGAHRQEAHA
jgi:hypothetical protein